MALRGIMFDLGGTLLRFRPDHMSWESLETEVAQRVYAYLRAQGFALPPESEAMASYWQHFHALWENPAHLPATELKLDVQTTVLACLWNLGDLSAETRHGMAQTYIAGMRAYLEPMAGAAETLRALREQGLRVGLISNTIWPDAEHMIDLDRYGLTPFIEHFIFSAEIECWKPERAIFERGLAALDLLPHETAFVGDSLYFDVWGAQQAGLRGVWIESSPHVPGGLTVTPDACVTTLPELLPLATRWQKDDAPWA